MRAPFGEDRVEGGGWRARQWVFLRNEVREEGRRRKKRGREEEEEEREGGGGGG